MTRVLYILRHCQARGQEPDAPLTDAGREQAIALRDRLCDLRIDRIISSPFVRARESIRPLAERLGIRIEQDERLVERVLSSVPIEGWRQRLAETFDDLDLCFAGGESSRSAMLRGVAVVNDVIRAGAESAMLITHGNLMTLILKHFDPEISYPVWESLRNPDLYSVRFDSTGVSLERSAL